MKYRSLHIDELQEMESEFIQFLALLSITSADWERMKVADPVRVQHIIEDFSETVFDRVLQRVDYLEFRSTHTLRTFYFGEEKAFMLGLLVEGESPLNFTQNQTPEEMLAAIQMGNAQLSLQQAEKKYQKSRQEEIFHLMESGARISKDGELYKLLDSLRTTS